MSDLKERVRIAEAVLKAVVGLQLHGMTLTQAQQRVKLWLDQTARKGAFGAEAVRESTGYYERQLIEALTEETECPHRWGGTGACEICGVHRQDVDPEGYARWVRLLKQARNPRGKRASGKVTCAKCKTACSGFYCHICNPPQAFPPKKVPTIPRKKYTRSS